LARYLGALQEGKNSVSFLGAIYVGAAVMLALYGVNSLVTLALYLRHRGRTPPLPPLASTPRVTVQLPIYNERYVVERLIDAVAALDYPRDRFQIQVLDDSTDETTAIAQDRAAYHRRRGVDIVVIHRTERIGFKAGALAHGLSTATGEFTAVCFNKGLFPYLKELEGARIGVRGEIKLYRGQPEIIIESLDQIESERLSLLLMELDAEARAERGT